MIAVFAPGQGAQSPGMLAPWLDLPGVAEELAGFSDATGLDLQRLGTTADADEIKDTAVTQPLLVALGVIAAGRLGLDGGERVVAGHSVGELTAAAVAGALTPVDAVAFAARRGAEMAAACAVTPTGMSAVLGGEADEVVAGIEAAGLTAANRNGAGQIVAAGELDRLERLAAEPPGGARAVRALAVAGAFHTHHMEPAAKALGEYVDTLDVADPRPILLSNADGAAVTTGADLVARLVRQVTLPVRWDLCLRSCADLGVTAVIELAPGGVLTGIAKRELPGVELLAIKSPDDLEKGRALVASRPQHGQGEHTPEFRIVVTPTKGVFTRAGVDEGGQVARGAQLGTIRTNQDEHVIVAPQAGVLAEWLRHDGDIVAAGLPVARLADGSEY
ncbi:[acyl-carrier-protein] S-malonyltransferase [Jatrophihabitans endophyticus]|uniref:[acyl-carrier-protein] S-malonyltransferase n=1 Tax=Jatrophihabitans endophyticus TaxID=1206085 RepID=A0A1M5KRA0_9ACTN|nr:acyltransferase domain-containing protein [Jatrophihabitans endophyticus]SHG55265.1 [acyl-carrier-protein] S-malonyltransferase [Jatrophihabitans endophyticus]